MSEQKKKNARTRARETSKNQKRNKKIVLIKQSADDIGTLFDTNISPNCIFIVKVDAAVEKKT